MTILEDIERLKQKAENFTKSYRDVEASYKVLYKEYHDLVARNRQLGSITSRHTRSILSISRSARNVRMGCGVVEYDL